MERAPRRKRARAWLPCFAYLILSSNLLPVDSFFSSIHMGMAYKRARTMEQMSEEMDALQDRLEAIEASLQCIASGGESLPTLDHPIYNITARRPQSARELELLKCIDAMREGLEESEWEGRIVEMMQIAQEDEGEDLSLLEQELEMSIGRLKLRLHELLGYLEQVVPQELQGKLKEVAPTEEAKEIEAPGGVEAEGLREREIKESSSPHTLALHASLKKKTQEEDALVSRATQELIEGLNEDQREQFDKLKEAAEGQGPEERKILEGMAICGDMDGVYMAFLRHCKFNSDKAIASMQRALEWRKEYQIEEIFQPGRRLSSEKTRHHRSNWPTGFHKSDKMGRPVFYDRVGQANIGAMGKGDAALNLDDMVQMYCQNMEIRRRYVFAKLSREAGKPVTQMVTVIDLKGLGTKHLSKDVFTYLKRVQDIFQDNYSDMVAKLVVVNAPWIFSRSWSAIKSFLSPETIKKVHIAGTGEAALAELRTFIDDRNIADVVGGSSQAVIGVNDKGWIEIDAAMDALGRGQDPFLAQAEVLHTARDVVVEMVEEEVAVVRSDEKSEELTKRVLVDASSSSEEESEVAGAGDFGDVSSDESESEEAVAGVFTSDNVSKVSAGQKVAVKVIGTALKAFWSGLGMVIEVVWVMLVQTFSSLRRAVMEDPRALAELLC
ncbi:unnamed protein product [Chrysoparadoxa australica]